MRGRLSHRGDLVRSRERDSVEKMRQPRGRLCALRVAGYVPDASFLEAQRLLSDVVVSSAAFEPPVRPETHAAQQAARDRSTRFSLGWHTVARDSYYIAIKYRDGLSELSEARNSYFVAIWTDSPPLFFIATQIGAGS